MKLFAAALLVVFCAGAALARPEESAAPAEQPAVPAEQTKEPATPVVPPTEPAAEPSKPAKKPTRPASILEGLLSKVKELLAKISKTLNISKGTSSRAGQSLADKKKNTIAKIEKLKAELQAKDKSIVVPSSPKDKRDSALNMKATIKKAIQELDSMKAEILKLK